MALGASKIQQIYDLLFDHYGAQGWWPVTPVNICSGAEKKPLYGIGLKNDKQKFEIVLGAILTQNTAWNNVEKAIVNLNENGMVNIGRINDISEKELAEMIKPAGYYNQKAKKLKVFVKHMNKNYGNDIRRLFKKRTSVLRSELLSLHGVGPETADSIMLYAAEKPVFVIDTYTKRIFSRIGLCKEDISYDELQEMFMENLETDAQLFNEYHALVVEHGKNICKTRPLCEECVLNSLCNCGLTQER